MIEPTGNPGPPSGASAQVVEMLQILRTDLDDRLLRIDNYHRGLHDRPYVPDSADDEFKQLADRCITNWMPSPVNAVAQGLAVDGYRQGHDGDTLPEGGSVLGASAALSLAKTPQWRFWQDSRLDARQGAVHRAALTYGHAFVLVLPDKRIGARARILSPLRTTVLFEDPANDEEPIAGLYVKSWSDDDGYTRVTYWDSEKQYEARVKGDEVSFDPGASHGSQECPIVRFAAIVDIDGRTMGVVEPLIPLQDRINQVTFDLLVASTYGSFKVRTVTGMAPPMMQEPVYEVDEDGNKVLDPATGRPIIVGVRPKVDPDTGEPIPARVNLNVARLLFAEDEDTKFDTLDETPLSGYIESIELAMRQFAAISQTPPHYMLGQIANVSAEALNAAEHALTRKIGEFQNSFGESWERVFRLAMALKDEDGAGDYSGEVEWRDLGAQSFGQVADGLTKFADGLEIPRRGLWHRVPQVTSNEIAMWERLREEDLQEQADQPLYEASGRSGSLEVYEPEEAVGAAA